MKKRIITAAITGSIHTPTIDPPEVLQHLASGGHFGIKGGEGFYDYGIDFSKAELDGAIQRRDQSRSRQIPIFPTVR